MNSGYVLTRLALRDMEQIWRFIASDSIKSANRMRDIIFSKCTKLARLPTLGSTCDHLHLGLRFLVVKKYVIYYVAKKAQVVIVRILHSAREHESILADGPFEP